MDDYKEPPPIPVIILPTYEPEITTPISPRASSR